MNTLRFLQIVSSDPIYNVHVLRDPPVLLIDIPTFGIWRRYLNQIFPLRTESLRSLLAAGGWEWSGGSMSLRQIGFWCTILQINIPETKISTNCIQTIWIWKSSSGCEWGERGPANIIGYAHLGSHQHAPLGRRLHPQFHLLGLDQCLPQSNKTTSSPLSGPPYDAGPDMWRPETQRSEPFHFRCKTTFCSLSGQLVGDKDCDFAELHWI